MLTMVIILCRGNDFRVAYAHLGELRSVINENVNVMALTATATKENYEAVLLAFVNVKSYHRWMFVI